MLEEVAHRVVPESADLDGDGREHFLAIIDRALGDRPPPLRRQIGVFLGLIRWAPLVRFGAPFTRLSPERRDSVLRWLQDGPVALFRKGFWGLKALVFMGYYGRPEVWPKIGYTAEADGRAGLGA